MSLDFKKVEGKKKNYGIDYITKIKTEGWHTPSNIDICKLIVAVCENEETIYPRSEGFSGCGLFLTVLNDVFKKFGYSVVEVKR